jgi:hypothetical protein
MKGLGACAARRAQSASHSLAVEINLRGLAGAPVQIAKVSEGFPCKQGILQGIRIHEHLLGFRTVHICQRSQ